jgi:hypothetical protein
MAYLGSFAHFRSWSPELIIGWVALSGLAALDSIYQEQQYMPTLSGVRSSYRKKDRDRESSEFLN